MCEERMRMLAFRVYASGKLCTHGALYADAAGGRYLVGPRKSTNCEIRLHFFDGRSAGSGHVDLDIKEVPKRDVAEGPSSRDTGSSRGYWPGIANEVGGMRREDWRSPIIRTLTREWTSLAKVRERPAEGFSVKRDVNL